MEVDHPEPMAGQEIRREVSMEDAVFDDSLQERRLIIVGKTGNGKSSVGNILLGKRHFHVGFSMTSTTLEAGVGTTSFQDWKMKVFDTPDIANMGLADEDAAQREVGLWKTLTSPGCHAILLAVRCDVRYTREEYDIYLQLKKLWGGKPLCRRLIVAFTFGDRQDRDIQQELKEVCPELKNVLKDASQRFVVFNDKANDEGKQTQVAWLKMMVDKLHAEELKDEERRLLMGVQVCPQGPLPGFRAGSQPSSRTSSKGSRGSSSSGADVIRLVLVGKPGKGKSATGNTIIGRNNFPVHSENKTVFHASSTEEVEIDGRRVQVVDTPGLELSSGDTGIQREWRRALELSTPGAVALLFVVKHKCVNEADLECFRFFRDSLGQGLSHHTVVVLVGVSPQLQEATRRHPDEGKFFDTLLEEAGNKLWAVSNKDEHVHARMTQVNSLMSIVLGIMHNSGGRYFHWERAANEVWKAAPNTDKHRKNSCWFL